MLEEKSNIINDKNKVLLELEIESPRPINCSGIICKSSKKLKFNLPLDSCLWFLLVL